MVPPVSTGRRFLLCPPRSTNSTCANRSHYKQNGSERDTRPNQSDQVGETTSMPASTAAEQRRTS
jgi:hypothetical protein